MRSRFGSKDSLIWIDSEIYLWFILLDKPEGIALTTSAVNNTATQGDTVIFTCDVTAARPLVSQYTFFLNDTLVKASNDSQYTINNVQRSDDFGEYKCLPRNDVGNGTEATVKLNVNGEYLALFWGTSWK